MNNLLKLETLMPLIEATGQEDIKIQSKFLRDRINHPDSYIVFLGETSSGKSSIINGLLGEDILPMKASPSTTAITEIEITDQIDKDEYYAINKNATMEIIGKTTFQELCEEPDDHLQRLRLRRKTASAMLKYARIFDTPGYGSIVAEHEEVMKDFLPNSDFVVYTINYKIGIQQEDFTFMSFLKELIREDVEVVLVVNRCPAGCDENDLRIKEIKSYAKGILKLEPTLFYVENVNVENGGHPIPNCSQLWEYVNERLSSDERQNRLDKVFDIYIRELYNKCDDVIQTRYLECQLDEETYNALQECQRATANRLRQAVPELIEPAFDHISSTLPSKFEFAANHATQELYERIGDDSKWHKDEMVGYINAHLLPHTLMLETREIQNYIEVELDDLNNKVDDYIQKEIIKFNNELSIRMESNIEAALKENVAKKFGQRIGENLLGKYFAGFGGAGGAGAGVANAASHALKTIGDWFGKTFSRETHNGLKHFLANAGATSAKAIGAAVAVLIELLTMVIDLATWKAILRKKIRKGIDKWATEALPTIQRDFKKLKEDNIETMYTIAREFEKSYDETKPTDFDECFKNVELSRSIGEKLRYLNY